jgi:hypothetical protein
VRHLPEVGHFGELAKGRHHDSQRAQKWPGHVADLELAVQRLLDRPRQFRAGDRVAGKSERLEFTKLRARFDQPHQCGGEIGQVSPRVNHVEWSRIGEAALLHITDDHAIEPAARAFVAATVEITCAQDDATDA